MTIANDIEKHLSVVVPAYNEEGKIHHIISKIHNNLSTLGFDYEIIVIDDGSNDMTAKLAQEAGAEVISHTYNLGNGAAVKTGIRAAKGEYIILMDGDGQHNPDEIPEFLRIIDKYDMVVGARSKRSDTELHRDVANKIYNLFASYICARKIPDLTSGFRALKTDIAREFLPILPNTFSYPTTITLAVARSGYQYTYHPIASAKRAGKSKIKLFRDGLRFLVILFKIATLFSPLKVFIPAAMITFIIGFGYGLYKVVFLGTPYGPTSAMLMTISGVIFLIGLISEQITQLMFNLTKSTYPKK